MKRTFFISLFFICSLVGKSQQSEIDSLINLAENSSGLEKADLQITLAWELKRTNDSLALSYGREAIDYYRAVRKDTQLSEAIYIIGTIHARNGRSYEALQNFLEAIELLDSLGLERGKRSVINNIGLLYKNTKQYDKAIEYYKEQIQSAQKDTDKIDLGIGYNNLGTVYSKIGKLELALETMQKGLSIRREIKSDRWIASSLGSIGNVLSKMGRYKEAQKYYLEALEKFKAINNFYGQVNTLNNIGSNYISLNNYTKAKEFLDLAEGLFDTSTDIYLKIDIYTSQEQLYNATGNYDKAYQKLKLVKMLNDSVVNTETNEELNQLEIKYRTAEKEKALAKEQARSEKLAKEATEAKLYAANRNKWVISLIALVVGIVLLFAMLRQRNKRRAQAEKDAAILKERDKGTQAVFLAQEEERKRIAKDLHDGIGQQLSGLKMAFQKVSGKIKTELPERSDELEKLSDILSESADEVRSISHQMMPKALTELGLIDALNDMLQKSFGLTEIDYEFDHFGVNQRLPEQIEISLYRVAQELVNNIIKHSKANKVNVQLFKNQGKIIMIIEDNGSGLVKSSREGHGLLNIKSRINTLNGELNLEPSPSSGTLATVRVPLE